MLTLSGVDLQTTKLIILYTMKLVFKCLRLEAFNAFRTDAVALPLMSTWSEACDASLSDWDIVHYTGDGGGGQGEAALRTSSCILLLAISKAPRLTERLLLWWWTWLRLSVSLETLWAEFITQEPYWPVLSLRLELDVLMFTSWWMAHGREANMACPTRIPRPVQYTVHRLHLYQSVLHSVSRCLILYRQSVPAHICFICRKITKRDHFV